MSESSLRPHSKDAAPTLAPLEPVASSASPASQAQSTAAETTTTPVSTSETVPAASQSGPASVENLTETLSNLVVSKDSDPSKPESSASTTTTNSSQPKKDVPGATEVEEELSPEEAKLRAMGLKSTHRPGFYIHLDAPKRLRIQTKSKTYDLDRYCPHARADMLKWGVLRNDMTLRCGVHYWGFDLTKDGQCIAHPEETLNACPVADSDLQW